MGNARYFVFEPFRLDLLDERLWDGDRSIRLSHKALAVLQSLVSRAGTLVTKDDLLATAWPDTVVGEAVLTTAIRELRRALGDDARAPRFVETVHGRGYRFVAQTVERQSLLPASIPPSPTPARPRLMGRTSELGTLHEWFAAAQLGSRRIGFIAGEAGIGKTALVEAFVADAAVHGSVRVSRGQCIEQFGAGEAYFPILDALERLGRDDASIPELLHEHAPSWLLHLPSLRLRGTLRTSLPVTPDKMLRDLSVSLERVTALCPLILVLEDLHWSDTATLECLAYLARRLDSARLLILGTYRPVEVALQRHPLRKVIAELRSHPQCGELVLDYLSRDAVNAYLLDRCGPVARLDVLADVLWRRTGGHPLFLATIVDELIGRQAREHGETSATDSWLGTIATSTPLSVRQFIEDRFDELSTEGRAVLEAAGVAGDPFSVAAVAAATSLRKETVDARCAAWSRERRFLSEDGLVTWPDGTIASRYRFRHALFQEVIYARTSSERRARLHRRIAARLERAYGRQSSMIAAELAMHFEHGRDFRRAVSYLEQAARNALMRSAYTEARQHLARGLEIVEGLPEGPARRRQELTLCLLLGQALMTTRGWGADEVERVYDRARRLGARLGDEPRLLETLWGLIVVSVVRAELRKTQTLASEILDLTKRRRDPLFRIAANLELGGTALALGQSASARTHFEEVDALYRPAQHHSLVARFGLDLGVFSRAWGAHALWYMGHVTTAQARCDESLRRARSLSHPITEVVALAYAIMLYQFCRDAERVDSLAEATIALCTEHGFPYYLAWAEILQGWSAAVCGGREEGVAEIRRGLGALRKTGGLRLPYYGALLAEGCMRHGRRDEALQAIGEAFADGERTQEVWWQSELHRLRGELLRSKSRTGPAEAHACLRTSIDVARQQGATVLEIRAAVSLAQLWRNEGKREEARDLLAPLRDRLVRDFAPADLDGANSLLKELDA